MWEIVIYQNLNKRGNVRCRLAITITETRLDHRPKLFSQQDGEASR
jgi:hypothetical protein